MKKVIYAVLALGLALDVNASAKDQGSPSKLTFDRMSRFGGAANRATPRNFSTTRTPSPTTHYKVRESSPVSTTERRTPSPTGAERRPSTAPFNAAALGKREDWQELAERFQRSNARKREGEASERSSASSADEGTTSPSMDVVPTQSSVSAEENTRVLINTVASTVTSAIEKLTMEHIKDPDQIRVGNQYLVEINKNIRDMIPFYLRMSVDRQHAGRLESTRRRRALSASSTTSDLALTSRAKGQQPEQPTPIEQDAMENFAENMRQLVEIAKPADGSTVIDLSPQNISAVVEQSVSDASNDPNLRRLFDSDQMKQLLTGLRNVVSGIMDQIAGGIRRIFDMFKRK
ncbi:MAG: hypothetical protein K6C34_04230 [Alphaproteobacteria bacterium]|nr:hypothetical protein [Alphaproteobacteria bacterium]